ncbi:MAG: hypothetical protein F6K23_27525 [Okeania sp. SIO2C9]|uniref:hypothetical protein n=1 Tax=Okeania sp. SIO2C9 TaxID=2607791 RepID=UPI0013C09E6D|nr:hypothetical protein [Okeania sp. SIO2C9]NEQ76457.1 hypothetical protein [Okeania sp. SIO2C9]
MGGWGDREIGRWGYGDMGRWGDRDMGIWGYGGKFQPFSLFDQNNMGRATLPFKAIGFLESCSRIPVTKITSVRRPTDGSPI